MVGTSTRSTILPLVDHLANRKVLIMLLKLLPGELVNRILYQTNSYSRTDLICETATSSTTGTGTDPPPPPWRLFYLQLHYRPVIRHRDIRRRGTYWDRPSRHDNSDIPERKVWAIAAGVELEATISTDEHAPRPEDLLFKVRLMFWNRSEPKSSLLDFGTVMGGCTRAEFWLRKDDELVDWDACGASGLDSVEWNTASTVEVSLENKDGARCKVRRFEIAIYCL